MAGSPLAGHQLPKGLVDGERGLLWSDACWVDPYAQTVAGYGRKAFQATLFPAAVTMTTVGPIPHDITEFVSRRLPRRLGDLLCACEDAAREYVKVLPDIALVRLLVAAWCFETESPRLFSIASDGGLGSPFEAVEIEHYISSGNSSAAYQLAVANELTPEDMLTVAEAQRAEPFTADRAGFEPFCNIGGQLVETEVTRAGVKSRVVREWGAPVG